MKNILFLVTGMTPQIITETVWALACDASKQNAWIPDEIQVLSTDDGLTQIRATLLDGGVFAQFQKDYPILANTRFDHDCLHAIQDDQQKTLKDLKTPQDNELAGDCICAKIRQLTQDDDMVLHVSIAGGRKTMGFYAGYALSLYGRACDKMSHVLVDSEFESAKDFYYPTLHDVFVEQRHTSKKLNAKNAQIWLADIPFVRMRNAIDDKHSLKQDASFSEVIAQINESFKPIHLTIDTKNQQIIINDGAFTVSLPPREFAMLHWFADLRKQGRHGVIAPTVDLNKNYGVNKQKDLKHVQKLRDVQKLSEEYRQYYDRLKIKDVFDEDEMKTLDMGKSFFESVKSRLEKKLKENLGLELANKIKPIQEKRGLPFYLNLNPNHIHITE